MKLALISGGSRGLGQALCAAYAALGYKVVEFSRSAPEPYSVATDFADPEHAARAFEDAMRPLAAETWDEIVVIHNAGVLDPIGAVANKRTTQVLDNINTNITSALLYLREAMRQFQSHACRKTLVNVSSGAARKGYAGWSLYCAGKAALENFVRAVALEQAQEEAPFVALNIDPGVMDTEMQATIRKTPVEDFPEVDRFVLRKLLGHLRPARDIAAAIVRIVGGEQESGGRVDAAEFLA
ncbi:SDR family NAD(P)-dependent oxidoreductase [Uliginosibacterium sp. H3]|uniref:SDR family NAD(P)-dependent oxidoreductase n=1 Tax=Uliginosibacterium silvisoli TaxID=3114758 RepID=A0ABU6K2E1_9RHOO|nr:SDR family NAD(P)-dependent oxidoreductase [Uliginosibacterium sp. H3]